MARNRIIWLLCWMGSLVFLLFYQRWLAWLLLAGVMIVPVFSLLVSLPAMVSARLEVHFPEQVPVGTTAMPKLTCQSRGIAPQWSCRLRVTAASSGKTVRLKLGQPLPTDHCGALFCTLSHGRVYDRLGLFALPLRLQRKHQVFVEPLPIPLSGEDADVTQAYAWKPKKGGFSENHELRLYNPGDDLRQLHWKLSAKIGKPVIREPMIPDAGQLVVQLELKGSPGQIDRILGNLLWLGQQFLEQQIPFDLSCLTGCGIEEFRITDHSSLQSTLRTLLARPRATSGSLPELSAGVTRLYKLGGDAGEN